jgi:hypothetical protein
MAKQYCIALAKEALGAYLRYKKTELELTSSSLLSNRITTIIITSLDRGLEYGKFGTLVG